MRELLLIACTLWLVVAFILWAYGMWQTAKIRGSAGWAASRTATILAFLWPLILLLAAGTWVWQHLSKGRHPPPTKTARPRKPRGPPSQFMERLEGILVTALAAFLFVEVAAIGVLRLLGVRGLVLALTLIGLPPFLWMAASVVSMLNDRRRQ